MIDRVLSMAELESSDPQARSTGSGGGRERRFLCPLCGNGKRPDAAHRSLAANADTGAWRCHRCGESGLLKEFRTERAELAPGLIAPGLRSSRRAARDQSKLQPLQFAHTPNPAQAKRAELAPGLPDGEAEDGGDFLRFGERRFELIDLSPDGAGREAFFWLLERREASPGLASAAGVRFCPDWHGRPAVVFPALGGDGRLIAAQGRFIDERENKPKTMSAGRAGEGAFACEGAWADSDAAVLCEAPLDALVLAACGLPALSLLGASMNPAWLAARLAFRRVLLAFDADAAGDAAAAAWTQRLERFGAKPERLRPDPPCKDWGEVRQATCRSAMIDALGERLGEIP